MGFFLDDKDVERMTAKPIREPKQPSKIESMTPGCDNCARKKSWARMHTPMMSAYAGQDPDVLVLGGHPNEEADRAGMPFDRDTLRMLRKAVPGREWDRLTLQNVVRCTSVQGFDSPSKAEAHSCSVHLNSDFDAHDYKFVIGIGDAPLRRLIPDWSPKSTARDLAGTFLPINVNGKLIWYYQLISLQILESLGKDNGPAWPVFRSDIKKFFDTFQKLPAPEIESLDPKSVIIVNTEQDASDLRARMGPVKAWDVETTGLRPTRKREILLTAAFSDGETTFAFSVDSPMQRNAWAKKFIADTLNGCDYWVAHQAAMELSWAVHHCGVELNPEKFHDTMCISRVHHDHPELLGLAEQSRIHLGVNVKKLSDLDTKNLIAYPLDDVLAYNGLDSLATIRIFKKPFAQKIIQQEAYLRLRDATSMTTQMQLYGLPTNLMTSRRLREKWSGIAERAELAAKSIYEVRAWERATQKEWSIGSGDDVGGALVRFGKVNLPKTPSGGWKADEPTLLAAAGDNPLVKEVLAYREATKIVSTYIDPILVAAEEHFDGQPHPCYTTALTVTERLSSEDFNIQNWPRRANIEIREQVEAPSGHIFVAFDYGQVEARIIAMASKDRYFCTSILTGSDIHADWGPIMQGFWPELWSLTAQIAGCPVTDEKKILKVMRDRTKNKFIFPSFYGAWPKSIAASMQVPEFVIEKTQEELWRRFPGVKNWMKARKAEYEATGSIRSLTGRTRHGILAGNEIYNSPIQSTAANVCTDAMNELASIARNENDKYLHPRVQIHDDLMFCLPEDDRLLHYIDRIFKVMAKCRYDWQIVPWLVEAKAGYSWDKLEEFGTFTGDYVH